MADLRWFPTFLPSLPFSGSANGSSQGVDWLGLSFRGLGEGE